MKAFKGKSYVAPVEKDRKELGKYQEKVTQKFHSSKGKISSKYKENYEKANNLPSKKIFGKKGKKKWSFCNYFILGVILLFVFLLIFAIYSTIFNKEKKGKEDL